MKVDAAKKPQPANSTRFPSSPKKEKKKKKIKLSTITKKIVQH